MFFQSTEVTLQSIGASCYPRIGNIVEQMGQSFRQKASCSDNVTEHPAAVCGMLYAFTIFFLPVAECPDEAIGLLLCLYVRKGDKKIPQALCIHALRFTPTPTQALALHMHKTALQAYLRPHRPKGTYLRRSSVYRCALRMQASSGQVLTESKQVRSGLPYVDRSSQNRISLRIHDRVYPSWTIKKSAITNNMLDAGELPGANLSRFLVQPIAYHPSSRAETCILHSNQFPDTVAFSDPLRKPGKSSFLDASSRSPQERLSAFQAQVALLTLMALAIAFHPRRETIHTAFFSSNLNRLWVYSK